MSIFESFATGLALVACIECFAGIVRFAMAASVVACFVATEVMICLTTYGM